MSEELGEKTRQVLLRLRKIEGQARGIQKMIETGRDCEEIVIRLAALKAAVSKACVLAVSGHLKECLLREGREESLEAALERATEMFMKIG